MFHDYLEILRAALIPVDEETDKKIENYFAQKKQKTIKFKSIFPAPLVEAYCPYCDKIQKRIPKSVLLPNRLADFYNCENCGKTFLGKKRPKIIRPIRKLPDPQPAIKMNYHRDMEFPYKDYLKTKPAIEFLPRIEDPRFEVNDEDLINIPGIDNER